MRFLNPFHELAVVELVLLAAAILVGCSAIQRRCTIHAVWVLASRRVLSALLPELVILAFWVGSAHAHDGDHSSAEAAGLDIVGKLVVLLGLIASAVVGYWAMSAVASKRHGDTPRILSERKPLAAVTAAIALMILAGILLLTANRGLADLNGAALGLAEQTAGIYAGTRLEGIAPSFQLMDQNGTRIALADFQGKVVLLAFLDPRCTDVCPLTAFEFRKVYERLGKDATSVAFLAVNTNPDANSVADVAEATQRWKADEIPTWHFLTGTRAELQPVWEAYNVLAATPKPEKAGEVDHTPGVFVIDPSGHKQWYVSIPLTDPGWDGPMLNELLLRHVRQLLKETA